MSTVTIRGNKVTIPAGAIAYKYADPIEAARWLFKQSELDSIRSRDATLIAWEAVIRDEQIRALGADADARKDWARVNLCRRALAGDQEARRECARVMGDDADHHSGLMQPLQTSGR